MVPALLSYLVLLFILSLEDRELKKLKILMTGQISDNSRNHFIIHEFLIM